MDNTDITKLLGNLSLDEKNKTKDSKKKVGYVYDPRMLLHRCCQYDHPERPDRIMSIHNNLIDKSLMIYLEELKTDFISNEKLLLVHPKDHIEKVDNLKYKSDGKTLREEDESGSSFGNDTYDNYESSNSARLSANSVIVAIDQVMEKKINGAFLAIRPPGHHASEKIASGFCFYNNVAIGAKHALKSHKLNKVAIVDWDVHHGNGTQKIFYNSSEVLFISIHRYDNGKFYPGPHEEGNFSDIGENRGKGFNINIPWNTNGYISSIGDDEYLYAFKTIVVPILREFQPELVLVSCGFDAAEGDPLGKLSISPLGYSYMTDQLKKIIGDKLIIVLEGGYNLKSLAKSSEAIIKTLIGIKPPFSYNESKEAFSLEELEILSRPIYQAIKSINSYKTHFEKYWKTLKKVNIIECKEFNPLEKDNQVGLKQFSNLCRDISINLTKYLKSDDKALENCDFMIFKIGKYTLLDKTKLNKYNKHIRISHKTESFLRGFRLEGLRIKANKLNWYKYEGNLENNEDDKCKYLSFFLKGITKNRDFLEDIKKIINQADSLKNSGYDLIGLNLYLFKINNNKQIQVNLGGLKCYSVEKGSNTNYFQEGIQNLFEFLENNIL